MNKEYERVREEIAKAVYYDCTDCPYKYEGDCVSPNTCKFIKDKADQILSIKGIAILSDDQSLPENPFFGGEPSDGKRTQWYGANSYKRLITEADFVKVVKEEE